MRRVDRLLVGLHHEAPPTSQEWARWLALVGQRAGSDLRTLVEVYGGVGPDPKQRLELAAVLKSVDVRTAIITDSVLTRGVVTAISWLGIPIHAYAKRQHGQAAAYLELTSAEKAIALELLSQLRDEARVPTGRRESLANDARASRGK